MPLVLLSGYAMLFGVYGGFAGAGWNVNVMHLLGLVMTAIFLFVFFGPWAAFRRGDADAVDRIRKLVQAGLLIGLVVIVVATLNGI